MEGKGIRSEEELVDMKCIVQIRNIVKRLHELEVQKEESESQQQRTAWGEEEERERRVLAWIMRQVLGEREEK